MKQLLSLLALTGLLMFSPNFAQASLLGDEVSIQVISPNLVLPPNSPVIVVDDPNNPEVFYSLCVNPTDGGSTIDIGDSEIWFKFSSGGPCTHDAHSVWLMDLDWTDTPGKIVGVTQGVCNIEFEEIDVSFGDNEIHFDFSDTQTSGDEIECHFDIHTEHDEVVGGEFLYMDSTALMLGGIQASAIWLLPTLAGIAGAGYFLVRTKLN